MLQSPEKKIEPFCILDSVALSANLDLICALAGKRQIALVIKGNAYGHGELLIARYFDADPRVAAFCTAGTAEGVFLRRQGITKRIIAMAYCDGDLAEAVAVGIEPSIATDHEYIRLSEVLMAHKRLHRENTPLPVHIKVDTGIARRGVAWQELADFYCRVRNNVDMQVISVFTHCADSSPEDPTFMYEQKRRFDCALAAIRVQGFRGFAHMASSGSLTLIPEYDMVRVGTMLYGFWKNRAQHDRVTSLISGAQLQPVMRLCAPISAIDSCDKSRTILYFLAGWAHGYRPDNGQLCVLFPCGCIGKLIENTEYMSSAEKLCNHVCAIGESVVLYGGCAENFITMLAVHKKTIANEIAATLSPSIVRRLE